MKSIKKSVVWVLSSIIVAVSFSACSNDLDAIEQAPSANVKALSYNSGTYLHVGTGTAFFTWYCGDYVSEILKNSWVPCEDTVGGRFWSRN